MRILHIIDHLGEGGSQELLGEIILLSDRKKYEMSVASLFAPHGTFSYSTHWRDCHVSVDELSGMRAVSRGRSFLRSLFFLLAFPVIFFRLARIVRRQRPDVLHAHFLFAYFFAALVGKITRTPVAFTIPALKSQMDSYSRLIFPAYRLFSGFIDHFFTALPEDQPEKLLKIPKEKITSFLGVVDVSASVMMERKHNPLIEEFSLSLDAFVVLGIGRFDPEKGHLHTLAAFKEVVLQVPNAVLFLLGEGPLRPECAQYIATNNLEHKVFLPGYRADAKHFFALADVFVRSYLYEGMNTSLQWAMAYGKAIVGFDNKSPSEILENGKTALLVDLKNEKELGKAITDLAIAQDKASRLGQNARAIAEKKLDVRHSIDIFCSIYSDMLSRSN